MKNFLKNGIIPIGAYCPPQPPFAYGEGYPNRITEEQYRIAKEAGIDILYAHNEVMNSPTEKYAFLSLEIAEKVGLAVYVRDKISEEYIALGDKDDYKAFPSLTEEEKQELDQRFENSLKRYCGYKAFAGISFWDEPGYDSFEGIARAKRVFDRVCPEKTFYVNMYPYYIAPVQYQFGFWCNQARAKATNPHFDVVEGGRNIDRYSFLYDEFIRIVNPDFFSYDAYPFVNFEDATTTVHEILWELPQYLHGMEVKNGVPFWVFLQAGGKWEGRDNVRIPTEAEVSLGVGVPLLYGAKGLQVFPYAYPNDWLPDKVCVAGLTGRYGEKTELFDYYKKVFSYVRAMQGYLVKGKLKGIIKSGEYKNGLPDKKRLDEIKWSDCIFQGELSKKENIEITAYDNVKAVESDVQCLTGCMDIEGKEAFFVVNDSSTDKAEYRIKFSGVGKYLKIYRGEEEKMMTDEIKITLGAGEFALVVKEN